MVKPVRARHDEGFHHHLRRKLRIFRPCDELRLADFGSEVGILNHLAWYPRSQGLAVEIVAQRIPDFDAILRRGGILRRRKGHCGKVRILMFDQPIYSASDRSACGQ
jgi:hypothetical protein